MPQYKKKPVTIEAHQWFKNGDHPDDRIGETLPDPFSSYPERDTYTRIEGAVVRFFRRPDVPGSKLCQHCDIMMHEHGWIDTLEGGHIVCPADYIITGVDGERYPCKPGIFAKTYDLVNETKEIERHEARRTLLQTINEAERGQRVLDAELKHGRFHTARSTLAALRELTKMQDEVIPKALADA